MSTFQGMRFLSSHRKYTFIVRLEGVGSDAQEVFGNLLDTLSIDPQSVIVGEVEYDESDIELSDLFEPADA